MSRCKRCHCSPCRCDMFDQQAAPGVSGNTPACWPQHAMSLDVHPAQIEAIMARNKRHGVQGVTYRRNGDCIVADRAAKRDLMALEGVHNKDGGYGDDHARETPLPPCMDDNPIHPEV